MEAEGEAGSGGSWLRSAVEVEGKAGRGGVSCDQRWKLKARQGGGS